jgi:hypothetical protein
MSKKYNIIINPISVFSVILIVFWLLFRFGIILSDYYYPTYYFLFYYRAFNDN